MYISVGKVCKCMGYVHVVHMYMYVQVGIHVCAGWDTCMCKCSLVDSGCGKAYLRRG